MKVNWSMELDDTALRKIGVAMGKRSAKATRKEIRIWLGSTVSAALAGLDAPRVAPKKAAAAAPLPGGLKLGSGVGRWKCPDCKTYVTCEIGRRCTDCAAKRKGATDGNSVEAGAGDADDLPAMAKP